MKSIVFASVVTMALLGLGLSSCTDDKSETQSNAESTVDSAADSVGNAADSTGDQISEWTDSTKAELGTFDNKFAEWKAEVQGKDAKAEYEEKMGELEKLRSEIGTKLENAGEVSQENWDEFKSDVNSKVTKLKSEMNEMNN